MVIEFLDGEREVFLGNNEDCLRRIVREKLGNDTEYLLDTFLEESNEKIETWKNIADENERIADGYYGMLNNILSELEAILEYMFEANRIDKQKVYRLIRECKDEIKNNI